MTQNHSSYYEEYWERGKSWSPSEGGASAEEGDLFGQFLAPGSVCLDYGCGDATRYGARLVASGVDYRGFDVSQVAVKVAGEHGIQISLLTTDGKSTLADASCDAAICFEVLEHLIEPDQALAEIFRVLKPGGHLLASVPNAAHWWRRVEFLATGFLNPGGSPLTSRKAPWRDPHIRFYSPTLFRRLAVASGFEVQRLFGEPFTLLSLPYLYKSEPLKAPLAIVSAPFGWIGRCFPGLFSARLFLVARKPSE